MKSDTFYLDAGGLAGAGRVQNKAGSIEITGMGVEIADVPQSTGSED